MAKQGLLLSGQGLLSYHFAESEHEGRRYRVIPKKQEEFSEDELELYHSSGWEFLFEENAKCFFYTDDPDAVEIFTDEQSYRSYLKKTLRKFLREACLCLLIIALWLAQLYLNWSGSKNGLEGLASRSLWEETAFITLILVILLRYAGMAVGYIACRRRILGKQKKAEIRWSRGKLLLRKIPAGIALVVLAAAICGLIFAPSQVRGEALERYHESCPVRFAAFDPDGWAFVKDHRGPIPPNVNSGVRFDYTLHHTSNLELADGYEESFYPSETVYVSEEETEDYPEYTSLTYDFRSEKLAKKLLMRQIGADQGDARDPAAIRKRMKEIAIQVPGTDYAGFCEDKSGQYLYLHKACRTVYVHYSGDQKIIDKLPLFAAQLEK